MDWMDLKDISPPEDMEILLWNHLNRAEVGRVFYDVNGHIVFIYLKRKDDPVELVHEYTHWCQIIEPKENT